MTKQEALNQVLSAYKALNDIIATYPENPDFVMGMNHVRTGILLIKEGVAITNFDDIEPFLVQQARAQEAKDKDNGAVFD